MSEFLILVVPIVAIFTWCGFAEYWLRQKDKQIKELQQSLNECIDDFADSASTLKSTARLARELAGELNQAKECIWQMEQVGDRMVENGSVSEHMERDWNKAKEAKL